VHVKVSDLDRGVAFYGDVLGFELRQRYGHQAAFLAADGCHHHIGLNGPTWEGRCAGSSSTGWVWTGASDHGGPEALYLQDPDGCFETSIHSP